MTKKLSIRGDRFYDALGREVLLRGVNLGGDSKLPVPFGGTHHPSDFADHKTVSFVGRPFPLSEATEHFSRLKRWGFNVIRLLVTWEAVEHAGPGIYDHDYLDYFEAIARLAGDFGLYVFIDFHQDAWSRMSGGSGAPGWTFDTVGLDFRKFHDAGAALVMQSAYDYSNPERHQASYPQMSWGTNYRLPANSIMWTLFFGGSWITPEFHVDGLNIQDYLQRHYLGSVNQVARRLAEMDHVIGFDTLNEPSIGWLTRSLTERPDPSRLTLFDSGVYLSPLDGLAVAQGATITVPVISATPFGAQVSGEKTINPDRVRIWKDGRACPFEAAGIYAFSNGLIEAKAEGAFLAGPGGALNVPADVFAPFFRRVSETIRSHRPDWIVFAEVEVMGPLQGRSYPAAMPVNSVNACHWYDVAALVMKTFNPDAHFDFANRRILEGETAVLESYSRGLGARKRLAETFAGPTLIGEFGVPFDLDRGESYIAWAEGEKRAEAFDKQALALGLTYDALDIHTLSGTIWNYTATNQNDARIGDGWNQEDLSIFSTDQQTDECDGERAALGYARPYPAAVQGALVSFRFYRASRAFELCFDADTTLASTEIMAPIAQYPLGVDVRLKEGEAEIEWRAGVVTVRACKTGRLSLIMTPKALAFRSVEPASSDRSFVFSPEESLKHRAH